MEEENYDKIISECTKEIESGGRYTAEALLLRATFYLLIGNATAAQPDLDRVINMPDANVKVGAALRPTGGAFRPRNNRRPPVPLCAFCS